MQLKDTRILGSACMSPGAGARDMQGGSMSSSLSGSADVTRNSSSSSSSSCSSSSNGISSSSSAVVISVQDSPGNSVVSIYDLYTTRRLYCIVLVVALAALTAPLANTMFLPAMANVQADLSTTAIAVTSSVAAFQVALGLGALLWGPASDRYGRKPVMLIATTLFILTNIPLFFTPNLAVLLAFRTLQGASLAAYASTAPGAIADVCSPDKRGTLFGVCSVAALLGPVLGPPLGGGLTQGFGWRSMYVLLGALSGLVILPLLMFCVPETLQYKVLQRFLAQQDSNRCKVVEAQAILQQGRPHFQAPWWPLQLLCDRQQMLHVLLMLLGYSTYITSLTVLPFYLSRPPYSLSSGTIGAAYLPGGLAALFGGPCGGRLADLCGQAQPLQPLRRLLVTSLLQLLLLPGSVLVLGWGLQAGWPLVVPLIALLMVSFLNNLYMPGLFTVLTMLKQQAAAAAVGGVYALLFLLSGSLMMIGTALMQSIGLGPLLSVLAVLQFLTAALAFLQIVCVCSGTSLPQGLASKQGSTTFVRCARHLLMTSMTGQKAAAGPADAAAASAAADGGGGGDDGGCGSGSGSGKSLEPVPGVPPTMGLSRAQL